MKFNVLLSRLILNDDPKSWILRKLKKTLKHDNFNIILDVKYTNLFNIPILYFGYLFNQTVDNLPNYVINLNFGHNFNQRVNKLPNSIITLTFGYNFYQLVDNLPNSIINLNFKYNFYRRINKLPNSIVNITIRHDYVNLVDNLPNSIIKINCECDDCCKNEILDFKKTQFNWKHFNRIYF